MLRKTVVALLAVASVGPKAPTTDWRWRVEAEAAVRAEEEAATAVAALVAAAAMAVALAGGGFHGGGLGGGGYRRLRPQQPPRRRDGRWRSRTGGGFRGGEHDFGHGHEYWRHPDSMTADSTTATGAVSDSALAAITRTIITTTTPMTIRMPMAIRIMTTAVAMWSSAACIRRMAGAFSPFRCAVDPDVMVIRNVRSAN